MSVGIEGLISGMDGYHGPWKSNVSLSTFNKDSILFKTSFLSLYQLGGSRIRKESSSRTSTGNEITSLKVFVIE